MTAVAGLPGTVDCSLSMVASIQLHDVNVNVNVEFKVTLHEQVRYRGTL